MLKAIKKEDKVPGKNLYGMFFAIKKEFMKSVVTVHFHIDSCHYLWSQGFKKVIGRMSSEKSLAMTIKIGAYVTA